MNLISVNARNWIRHFLWVSILVSLAVNAFPFFPPTLGGNAVVRPLSLFPLILIFPFFIVTRIIKSRLPKSFIPLFVFFLAAVASSTYSLFQGTEPLLGITVSDRIVRAILTLGIGMVFYVTVSLYPKTESDLKFTLKWLYIGFAVAFLWGLMQIIYIVIDSNYWFQIMDNLQGYVSSRKLFVNRISGPTFEPNWFADFIVTLALPFLISSVITGYSVFKKVWKALSVEMILLVIAIPNLVYTFSRSGMLIFLVLVFVAVLVFLNIGKQWRIRLGNFGGINKFNSIKSYAKQLGMGVLVVLVMFSFVLLAGNSNPFFLKTFNVQSDLSGIDTLSDYVFQLGIGARLIYLDTAFRTFETSPLIGVGLGNYVYFFYDNMPDVFLAKYPEILRLIVPDVGRNQLITPKNLYLKVVAETGIIGGSMFLAFLLSNAGSAFHLVLSSNIHQKFWGIAGVLGIVTLTMDMFSFDSFAIPNMWVLLGLITASSSVLMRKEKESPA